MASISLGVAVFKGLTAGKAIISVTAKITKPLTKSQVVLLVIVRTADGPMKRGE